MSRTTEVGSRASTTGALCHREATVNGRVRHRRHRAALNHPDVRGRLGFVACRRHTRGRSVGTPKLLFELPYPGSGLRRALLGPSRCSSLLMRTRGSRAPILPGAQAYIRLRSNGRSCHRRHAWVGSATFNRTVRAGAHELFCTNFIVADYGSRPQPNPPSIRSTTCLSTDDGLP